VAIHLIHFDYPKEIYIKDYTGLGNTVTIVADSPANLETNSPNIIGKAYGALKFIYDNVNSTWRPISVYVP